MQGRRGRSKQTCGNCSGQHEEGTPDPNTTESYLETAVSASNYGPMCRTDGTAGGVVDWFGVFVFGLKFIFIKSPKLTLLIFSPKETLYSVTEIHNDRLERIRYQP